MALCRTLSLVVALVAGVAVLAASAAGPAAAMTPALVAGSCGDAQSSDMQPDCCTVCETGVWTGDCLVCCPAWAASLGHQTGGLAVRRHVAAPPRIDRWFGQSRPPEPEPPRRAAPV